MSGLWTTAPQGLLYAALAMVPMLARRANTPVPAPMRNTVSRDSQCWWTP